MLQQYAFITGTNLIADFGNETFIVCLASALCIERSSIQKNSAFYTTGNFFMESFLESNCDNLAGAHIKFCGNSIENINKKLLRSQK
jgi:hypothetical protein